MKYYIIYLFHGIVVDVSSWDHGEEENRDRQYEMDAAQVKDGRSVSTYSFTFNEVQKLNQVC